MNTKKICKILLLTLPLSLALSTLINSMMIYETTEPVTSYGFQTDYFSRIIEIISTTNILSSISIPLSTFVFFVIFTYYFSKINLFNISKKNRNYSLGVGAALLMFFVLITFFYSKTTTYTIYNQKDIINATIVNDEIVFTLPKKPSVKIDLNSSEFADDKTISNTIVTKSYISPDKKHISYQLIKEYTYNTDYLRGSTGKYKQLFIYNIKDGSNTFISANPTPDHIFPNGFWSPNSKYFLINDQTIYDITSNSLIDFNCKGTRPADWTINNNLIAVDHGPCELSNIPSSGNIGMEFCAQTSIVGYNIYDPEKNECTYKSKNKTETTVK